MIHLVNCPFLPSLDCIDTVQFSLALLKNQSGNLNEPEIKMKELETPIS